MNATRTNRNPQYDTMRFLLILLVVFGHEMELFLSGKVAYLYKIIYTFHMPAFMFLTGKFAKFDKKRILKHLCLPYFVFQPIYLCFAAVVLSDTEIIIQFTIPYWILWYLLAIIFCYMLIPLLPKKESKWAVAAIFVSILVSILVGYETTVGYYLTLSRFFVFLPFFLYGYYQDRIMQLTKEWINLKLSMQIILSLSVVLIGEYIIIRGNIPNSLLYGSYGYAACGCSPMARVIVLITAFSWIHLLLSILPNTQIPVVSALGKNTMPIFILHAFVIRLLELNNFFHYKQIVNLVLAAIISVFLLVLLGNSFVASLFKKVF